MAFQQNQTIVIEQKVFFSTYLNRAVTLDFYYPQASVPIDLPLLLINDGQDLPKMQFEKMLDGLVTSGQINKIFVVGIHAGDRLSEFGTAHIADYHNRGEKAFLYQQFILEELVSFINSNSPLFKFKNKAIAGFSLGALSGLDICLDNPGAFSVAGMFSGSFWWRTKDLDNGYSETTDRIIHSKARNSIYQPGLKFYFTTGALDEIADRNNNGIIDSIDDTLDLIAELKKAGYKKGRNIQYINYQDGRHDVETWGKAMPAFLLWGWGKK